MIYACDNCGFLFQRVSETDTCPCCENTQIRPASGPETERLQEILNGMLQKSLKEKA